jgi:hypothetical protein
VITSKAANSYHFKTGQQKTPRTYMFYLASNYLGKSIDFADSAHERTTAQHSGPEFATSGLSKKWELIPFHHS